MFWMRLDGKEEGECRANPPVPMLLPVVSPLGVKGASVMAFFANTRADIWCGRHESRLGVVS